MIGYSNLDGISFMFRENEVIITIKGTNKSIKGIVQVITENQKKEVEKELEKRAEAVKEIDSLKDNLRRINNLLSLLERVRS